LSDETVRNFVSHERSFTPAWREAAAFLQTAIVASPSELEQITEQVQAVLAPFAASARDRAPRGSRVVHISVRAVPEP
jgi:hypothetical protein